MYPILEVERLKVSPTQRIQYNFTNFHQHMYLILKVELL